MKLRKIIAVAAAILMLGVMFPVGMLSVSAADSSADNPITYGGSSISEDVQGLAFKFDVAVSGMAVEKDGYTAIYDNAKLGDYKVVKMGAIASNGFDTQDVEAKKMYTVGEDTASFVVRIINIPQQYLTSVITMKPYITIEVDGVQQTIYGDEQAESYQETPDNWTPIG